MSDIGPYNNLIAYRLESPPGTPVDLIGVTKIDACIEDVRVTSSNDATTDKILWSKEGFERGELRCQFNAVEGLKAGNANCYFIAYDLLNPGGAVFGPVTLTVVKFK